jgi:hypothetical protein
MYELYLFSTEREKNNAPIKKHGRQANILKQKDRQERGIMNINACS